MQVGQYTDYNVNGKIKSLVLRLPDPEQWGATLGAIELFATPESVFVPVDLDYKIEHPTV